MKFLFGLILMLSAAHMQGAEPIRKVTLPVEVRQEISTSNVPDEIKGKVWNRWTSENFTVLSLNDTHAQYLHQHLELVKVWVFSRWGLYDIPFAAECKIIGVDDPDLFEKMFGIRQSRVEIRRDSQGQIQESVIFLLINDAPSHTVPVPLTEVCLAEFAQAYKQNLPWWTYRGMAVLNGSLDQIRASLHSFVPVVRDNKPVYFSDNLFRMTKADYQKLDSATKQVYDNSAVLFCLMIRKEFGENKFHWFLKQSCDQGGSHAVKEVLGFESTEEFDRTFRRYMIDLMRDIEVDKVPDLYLQIREGI